ncbi:MAG: DUF4402 domain-containing protein [Chlorobiaceae bacterium]|nr:DUF4402 domain-containing protein [Chlorobiaceae bacterium]
MIRIIWIISCLIATFGTGNAMAASTITANGIATINAPASVSVAQDLVFGAVAPGSKSGKVTINPSSGGRTSSNVTILSSAFHPAVFNITGHSGQTYLITLPNTITITNSTGQTMTANNFTKSTITTTNGTASFKVGASLNVSRYQNPGIYKGTFTVNVTYQ